MSAIGSYFGALRRGKGWTQERLVEETREALSLRTVRNIEAGRHDTSLATISLLLRLLGGSWIHIARLMRSEDTAMGKRLATAWLRGETISEEDHDFFDQLTPDDQARARDSTRSRRVAGRFRRRNHPTPAYFSRRDGGGVGAAGVSLRRHHSIRGVCLTSGLGVAMLFAIRLSEVDGRKAIGKSGGVKGTR